MDISSKLKTVIDDTSCGKHRVDNGVPCFQIPSVSGFGYIPAVCNRRARKLFTGTITNLSIQARRIKKEKKA